MEGSMHLVSPYPVSLYFPLLSWLAYDHLIWTDLLVFLYPQNIHKQTEGNICWVRFSINSKHPPDPPFSFIMYTNLSMMTIHLIKYSEWLQLDLKCCFLLSLSCVYVTYFVSCRYLVFLWSAGLSTRIVSKSRLHVRIFFVGRVWRGKKKFSFRLLLRQSQFLDDNLEKKITRHSRKPLHILKKFMFVKKNKKRLM